MIYKARAPMPTEAVQPEELGVEREVVTLTVDGTRHTITERRVVLGRSRECDVRVDDPNVSRRHAELQQEGATYWLVDLDSTNGTELNGKRVSRAKLSDGDRITLGGTDVVFGRSLP
jgi:pSer/pThr/pTyr-binding forkhead associated (FHA) protein